MTRNLKLFSYFCIAWSIPYFAILQWSLDNIHARWPVYIIAGVIYCIGFSLIGKHIGQRDNQQKVRYNLRLSYAVVAASIPLVIGLIWIAVWRPNYWPAAVIYVVIGLFSVALYSVLKKRGIKGLSKERLFK